MSITSSGAINILFDFIKESDLLTGLKKVSGNLFRLQRPINSAKEDVVINSLTMDRDDVQNGVLNVNIYVPNKSITVGGITDKTQPNTTRLEELSNISNTVLGNGNEVWSEDGSISFNIQQDVIFADENNQHYINFRIEFYSPNN